MPTTPRTVGTGGANAPHTSQTDLSPQDPLKTHTGKTAESTDSFDDDLKGNNRAGQHAGVSETRTYTAYDIKELHEKMSDFDNGELKRIPILAHGERLEQGAKYLDLSDPTRTIFTAQGSQEAQDPHLYVPKAALDYELWNRLTGVDVAAEATLADDLVPAR
ncbi:MAG: hypothetical protein H7Y38_03065 [Armatimonadetes bacterium]|nr:hypothetical protein [Armatimonadota bacterium]